MLVRGLGIAVGPCLVRFAIAAAVAAIINDQRVDTQIAKHLQFLESVGDIARVTVEEEDGVCRLASTRQEPAVDADTVRSGERDVLVLEQIGRASWRERV